VIHNPRCSSCKHWLVGYEATEVDVDEDGGLPVLNNGQWGWCERDDGPDDRWWGWKMHKRHGPSGHETHAEGGCNAFDSH
jgi:hypothetical protein